MEIKNNFKNVVINNKLIVMINVEILKDFKNYMKKRIKKFIILNFYVNMEIKKCNF